MGGGGTPSPPSPVAVPSAADEEAAEERARLYSLLRARRSGAGLAFGSPKRYSLLSTRKQPTGSPLVPDLPYNPFIDPSGSGSGGTGQGDFGGGDGGYSGGGPSGEPGGMGRGDPGGYP